MMLGSLRVRLWLSYLMVIGISVLVVLIGLFWTLQRSAFFYRQTALNIQLTGRVVQNELKDTKRFTKETLDSYLHDRSDRFGTALAVVLNPNTIVSQSGFEGLPGDTQLRIQLNNQDHAENVMVFRNTNHRIWFYAFFPINDTYTLLSAAPRPRLNVFTFFRQEFEPALLLVALVALLLALITSILMARWIASPLQHISEAAKTLAAGDYQQIQPEGPDDVRQLAFTFNEMVSQVQATQQSQHDFIANVSHELKTPLTSIQGFAQAILDNTVNTPADLEHAASIIFDESSRMNRLVLDLLSLTRLETGMETFDFSMMNLDALLQSVVERFAYQIMQKDISVEISKGELPPYYGDGDSLRQVFSNLLDNAIKFSPDEGKISIQTAQNEGVIEVRVTDEGPGIPEQQRERIFERFYQTDLSRKKRAGSGVGLGLAIAQQIVKAHNGTIRVDRHSNSGSTFVVSLPILSEEERKKQNL